MTFRDFDAEVAERAAATSDPITFRFQGYDFTCVNPLPVGTLIVAAKDLSGAQQMAMPWKVLSSWIVPEQHDDLEKALSKVVHIEDLDRLVSWLMEQATGRPS